MDDSQSPRTELAVLRAFDDLTGTNGQPLITELVDAYIATTTSTVAEIRALMAEASASTSDAVRLAHRLKGASVSVGAASLGRLSSQLEERLRAGDLEQARHLADALAAELAPAFDRLQAAAATLTARRD